MNFLRKLLFPFSLVYGGITALRNFLYNTGILKSKSYDLPVICVGNLSTGGTGKSPMIELLISFLKDTHKIAVLSRGYKRKTSGYREVLTESTAEEVGDEPLQFKRKFPQITVAVCEDRQAGIERLQAMADVVLLDDAFQHRKVSASLNLLLTAFDALYIQDHVLPTGNLREPRRGARRADLIVVTKCPENLAGSTMEAIKRKLAPTPHQKIYFSKIGYAAEIRNNTARKPLSYLKTRPFLLVTGIANPKPLVLFLWEQGFDFEQKVFPDHHNFTDTEIGALQTHPLLLTTEKDFMRLQALSGTTEIYYLPIRTEILNGAETNFKMAIEKAIDEK